MKNYFKIKNIIPFLLLIAFISCKGGTEQKRLLDFQNNELSDTVKIEGKKDKLINNFIHWELVDVTRFFDKPIEEKDLENFKKLKIKFSEDTLIINENKAVFTKENIDSKKYFGKGSLYVYFTDYLLNKFNINVKDKVTFLELDYEDARKQPFNYYFLKNDAVYTGDYLFLYNSDDYVLAFKEQTSKTNFREIYNNLNILSLPLKYSFEFISTEPNFIGIPKTYQKLLDLESFDNYSAIKLPQISKKVRPILLSAYDATGQPILYLYAFSEDYKFLDKLELYYSYDTGEGNIVTTYDIDKEYNIKIIKIENLDNNKKRIIETKNYKINNSGKFEKVNK